MSKQWPLGQVDVNNTFLNGDLTEEVYMHQPPGYVQLGTDGKLLVCRLTKALYRLRQAPRVWFEKLKAFIMFVGFVASKFDASLFIRNTDNTHMFVLVYVDYIIITGSATKEIEEFVA